MELLELLKELAGKHRYAGTENESRACGLLADRLKEIGCEIKKVKLEETADLVELFVRKLNEEVARSESGGDLLDPPAERFSGFFKLLGNSAGQEPRGATPALGGAL